MLNLEKLLVPLSADQPCGEDLAFSPEFDAINRARFEYDDALVSAVLSRCTEVDSGARNVDNILNGTLLPEIADSVLARMAEGGAITRVKVGATKAGKFKYAIE
jgi:type VI secretion system protein VasG